MTSPVIPGFHPDPSVCRVDDRFFLANSSFEYLPGVPLFTSRDLVEWEQVGNALDGAAQPSIPAGLAGASSGIYAPTLRHHGGLFWLVTTNIHLVRDGHLIVHAENIEGPWSEPVYTKGLFGIDPDLVWDAEGNCHLAWSDVVNGGISVARVDPFSGKILSDPQNIWHGTGGAHPEGPHLYSRNGWWYLLAAEGGTAAGHMVTIARSRAIDGPYESNPSNPILTHRSTTDPVQSTGHADLVDCGDGEWAMVHLGTRPRGSFPKWHTNGRETFLAGVDWVDDWPVVVEDRYSPTRRSTSFSDRFETDSLHPRWIGPGSNPKTYTRPAPGGLELAAGRAADSQEAVRLLATRVHDVSWRAVIAGSGDIALSVRIDDAHQAIVERVGATIRARVIIGPVEQVLAIATDASPSASLTIEARPVDARRGERQGPDCLVLGYESGTAFSLVTIDGRYISTEIAGGFTGRVLGVEALGAPAVLHNFTYSGA
jgi:xylan 1,4-beta-xylosidase